MKDSDRKFWPYKPKVSILSAIIILIGLLIITGILRSAFDWPSDASTNTVLIGILLLSILPIALAMLDVIIEKGGTVGYGDFKIDFSKVQQSGTSGFTIPANIGVRGQPVNDSSTSNILDALKQATSSGTVVINLEDGHAWWETRLFVLLAGAVRLGKPDKIVFVATDEGKEQCYQGWCNPTDLMHCLVQANSQYGQSLSITRAAARQWELVEPLEPIPPGINSLIPAKPIIIVGDKANRYSWMAFNNFTGMPNELMAEQLLQNDLGEKIELKEGSKHISIVRLNELFRPVLIKQNIDQSWPVDQQKNAFLDSDYQWIAITNNGKYSTLVSRLGIVTELLRSRA